MITKYWLVLLMLGSAVPAVCMEERPNQSPTFLMCPELDAWATVKNILSFAMHASYQEEALPAEGGKGPDDTTKSQPAIISGTDRPFDASRGLNATPLIHLKVLQNYMEIAQTILKNQIDYNTRESKEAGWCTTLYRIKCPVLVTSAIAVATTIDLKLWWNAYQKSEHVPFISNAVTTGFALITIGAGYYTWLRYKANSPTRLRTMHTKLATDYTAMKKSLIIDASDDENDNDSKTMLQTVLDEKQRIMQNTNHANFSVFLKPTDCPLPTVPD